MTIKEKTKQAEDTFHRVADSAHEAADAAAEATAETAEKLHAKGEKLHATQQEMSSQVRDYVKKNPMTSLAIAALGGYIASRLFDHR